MTAVELKEKIVGIIGGMGPEATVDLMSRVIKATPAKDDVDHVRMIVDNNPKVPSRIKVLIDGTGESPAPCMIDMARNLERCGADFLVIPCNTAHFYYADVAAAVSIPVINLIDLSACTVIKNQPAIKKVGMLASTAVLKTELYHQRFLTDDIEALFPEGRFQEDIMQLIKQVKANDVSDALLDRFTAAADNLLAQGAECLVIACTELSVLAEQLRTELRVYDANQLLAETIVKRVKTA